MQIHNWFGGQQNRRFLVDEGKKFLDCARSNEMTQDKTKHTKQKSNAKPKENETCRKDFLNWGKTRKAETAVLRYSSILINFIIISSVLKW